MQAILIYSVGILLLNEITGELLAVDTVVHLLVLVVVAVYARRNRRAFALFLALASPMVFVFSFFSGPTERTDFWGQVPTEASVLTGYVIANLVLIAALVIAASRGRDSVYRVERETRGRNGRGEF